MGLYTTGDIVNLMSVGTQKVMDYIEIFNLLWVTPLLTCVSIWLLWGQLGIATLGGIVVMLILLPINGVVTAKVKKYQFFVSLGRINKYLRSDELDPDAVLRKMGEGDCLAMNDGSFAWSKGSKATLNDLNISIPKGSLTAVIGSVGSGKSSMVSAFFGDMLKLKGAVCINGSVAYCPQQAWIQNASVQKNITFGQPFDRDRYEQVIEACALRQDLDILPERDDTEVGREDSNVGKHILDKVRGPKGLLRKKTRVLVTNRLSVLPQVDKVVVLHDGKITDMGTYEELLTRSGAFSDFLEKFLQEDEMIGGVPGEDMQLLGKIASRVGASKELVRPLSRLSGHDGDSASDTERGGRRHHISSKRSTRDGSVTVGGKPVKTMETPPTAGAKLTGQESSQVGSVKWWVYLAYIKAMGKKLTALMLVSYVFSHTFNIMTSYWLSLWSNDALEPELATDPVQRNFRLGMYAMYGLTESEYESGGTFVAPNER
ncbi:hypothetical protein V5799_028117 [Amblyomma americanum]|uniref:Uncharacterized protein n=1 Tax=Amblyomma americanum TaxID=6943 RepID=A0AAQ4DDS6_AMBAM